MHVLDRHDPNGRIRAALLRLTTAKRVYGEKLLVYRRTREAPGADVRDRAAHHLADAYRALQLAHGHLLTEVLATRPNDSLHDVADALGLPIDDDAPARVSVHDERTR